MEPWRNAKPIKGAMTPLKILAATGQGTLGLREIIHYGGGTTVTIGSGDQEVTAHVGPKFDLWYPLDGAALAKRVSDQLGGTPVTDGGLLNKNGKAASWFCVLGPRIDDHQFHLSVVVPYYQHGPSGVRVVTHITHIPTGITWAVGEDQAFAHSPDGKRRAAEADFVLDPPGNGVRFHRLHQQHDRLYVHGANRQTIRSVFRKVWPDPPEGTNAATWHGNRLAEVERYWKQLVTDGLEPTKMSAALAFCGWAQYVHRPRESGGGTPSEVMAKEILLPRSFGRTMAEKVFVAL